MFGFLQRASVCAFALRQRMEGTHGSRSISDRNSTPAKRDSRSFDGSCKNKHTHTHQICIRRIAATRQLLNIISQRCIKHVACHRCALFCVKTQTERTPSLNPISLLACMFIRSHGTTLLSRRKRQKHHPPSAAPRLAPAPCRDTRYSPAVR